jgi:hypothetical protein
MSTLTFTQDIISFICNDKSSSACRGTDLQGGSTYGYKLLIVVLLSNFVAMYLQYLALKLGVVAERDLAQACRDAYPKASMEFLPLLSPSQGMLPCCFQITCWQHAELLVFQ